MHFLTVVATDSCRPRGPDLLAALDAPALAFPVGVRQPNDYFEGDWFTGPVYMSSIRVPLIAFTGIDLGNVVEVALVFDQTDSGRIFVADLEFITH